LLAFLDLSVDFTLLIRFGIIARIAGYGEARSFRMREVAVTALASSVEEACSFQI
jgi:hypothetical protein